jgi:catechol 2,3-dioxygenase-like lactoylglutathione lyase family enzyme
MAARDLRTDFDHVALGSEHAWDNLDRYRGDLGGEWAGGGIDPGYYWGQVRFANGMRVEMLEPIPDHPNDFLRRFLDRNGPGPHHLTFKVPDILARIDAAGVAGYEAIHLNLESEIWKEAFLHPKASHGIVIQLAESNEDESGDPKPDPLLPPPRCPWQATLVRIVHLVASLDDAIGLFEGVLEGSVTRTGTGGMGPWADLAWLGPGRIRLLQPAGGAVAAWMGDRPGRLHHLAFRCPDPTSVRHAIRLAEGLYEIAPESNLGMRLRLRSSHLQDDPHCAPFEG